MPPSRLKQSLARLFATAAERRHGLVGPPRLWKMKRDFQLDFLKRMGLERAQWLLDLGCGTLRGGLPLIELLEPGHYTGVDVRAEVLAEARAELVEAGLAHKTPELVLATDLAKLALPRRFDVVWAFSVLIHMDDATLEGALAFVARQLAPDGAFYANVRTDLADSKGGAKSAPAAEERWGDFPVVTRPLEFYRAAGARHGLAVRDLGSLAGLGHASGDPAQDGQRMLGWRAARAPA